MQMLEALMALFLAGAVVSDVVRQRLPNLYLLAGLCVATAARVWLQGPESLLDGLGGMGVGLALFLPMYVLGGMAAGDVKLMAVTGAFVGYPEVLWAAALSVVSGGVLAMLYLAARGSAGRFLLRYWLMVSTRSILPASADDPARHRFPYALAIAVGTLTSLYWHPF